MQLKHDGWTFNLRDLEEFVQNDEGWYLRSRRLRGGLRRFVVQHRPHIEADYRTMLNRPPSR